MAKKLQAVRGMRDILPDQTPLWQFVENTARQVFQSYAYREIRTPVLEMTELFKRSIGEVTDIVEKEMYTFEDRNGDSLTLRPEGTAGCVRACMENGLLHNQVQRLWYQGAMFRHERPQKGRYREFKQMGLEAYGMAGPDIDLEVILVTARLWEALGIPGLELQINTLGTPEERTAYRARLVAYLQQHRDQLDEDSLRRMQSNPLRVLDSKNPDMAELIAGAPSLMDDLGETSRAHFEVITSGLEAAGVDYVLNTRLVRGLDYYSRTVFEWVTDLLGAQGTVCAGGRYDGLVEQLGGKPVPAIGFGMGVDRVVGVLQELGFDDGEADPHVYMVLVGERVQGPGLVLAERLRNALPGLRLQVNCGGGSFKSQFKKADKSGARLALILGEDELNKQEAGIKWLREQQEQVSMAHDELADFLKEMIGE
ncbi:histidine--tRNA ligase [Thiolapillus brandeum]|uniref:Histidine--tRNA ligase n=1 Tax=Thiolapillus brandeum TaxID=1076588 RepID=A0A7U6JIF7_9GAMM|nr:histidine--tRNA ligase [Thiolapillus brandeum]BAO44812.1 histidyl-tRNA synthetase [Thiolapillus brandeum]